MKTSDLPNELKHQEEYRERQRKLKFCKQDFESNHEWNKYLKNNGKKETDRK